LVQYQPEIPCPLYDTTKGKLAKENLTFAFALACAAAHAGPKSGSSEEPTYETRFERVSIPANVKNMTTLCNSQKGADLGLQRGNSGVLGYLTVPGREKKRSALLGHLIELAWRGPTQLKLEIHFPEESSLLQ
jgi:hypothetical protein